MSASVIIFYIIAAFILVTAFLAVTTRKIFRAAIWLLFSLLGIAALYFWLQVEFIAAVQIIVYVGGIVVLIIFSIFLTQQAGIEMPKTSVRRMIISMLSVLTGCVFTCMLINQNDFKLPQNNFDSSIARIGTQMMDVEDTGYALPFEVVSILLLAAMIGSIVIAKKEKVDLTNNSRPPASSGLNSSKDREIE